MYYSVVGTQWGDEGKGKIVDWLSSIADIVVRFQGGNNAGHTIKINEQTYKLNLLPSGIIRGKKCIIGNGVVLNPWALNDEINSLRDKKIKIDENNLIIAENICLILPIHQLLDEINEGVRGDSSIGTTKKGIGPAYEDKIGRRSIRLCDLFNEKILLNKIKNLISFHNIRLEYYGKKINEDELFQSLIEIKQKIGIYSAPAWKLLNNIDKEKVSILFEGAQGALLDIDFGTYPYVTSSNTNSGQIFAGTGFSIRENHKIFGITKAYTTRVGSGPFPTELNDKIGIYLGDKGKEFGTVTLRKRRCGWFDAILVKQSTMINSVDEIVLTKLDVLDELDEIKICVGYQANSNKYDYLPYDENIQNIIEPIYKTFPGWKKTTFGIDKWKNLPLNAQKYISAIEELIEKKITIISTGPERTQTIDKKNYLNFV